MSDDLFDLSGGQPHAGTMRRSFAETEARGRCALAYCCHGGRWDNSIPWLIRFTRISGRVDILVNHAGMSPLYQSLVQVSEELFHGWRLQRMPAHAGPAALSCKPLGVRE